MNKQELINKLKKQLTTPSEIKGSDFDCGHNYGIELATIFARQLEEPEKPVVPQSIADWLEVCKENLAIGLFVAMNPNVLEVNNQSAETIYWLKSARNQETFAKAWLFGYEVEEEKLYTVEIPNPNASGYGKTYLAKNKDGKVELYSWSSYTSIDFADNWKQEENAQLTEAEIKKDFEWAFRWAEEVKE